MIQCKCMRKFFNRKNLILVASFVFFVVFVFVFNICSTNKMIKNEAILTEQINNLEIVSYADKTLDKDLHVLLDLAKKRHTDSFLGFLYERISFVYKCLGDDLNYYSYLGKSLYRLEKSNNYQIMLNLYSDLIEYQYIPNGNLDLANQIIIEINQIENQIGIEDPRIKSQIYRVKGDLAYYNGNDEKALEFYEIAKTAAENAVSPIKEAFVSVVDIHVAKVLAEQGRYEDAKKIIDEYSVFFDDQQEILADVVTKTFTIPYCQTACCYYAYAQDYENLQKYADLLIKKCDEQTYERMAIITLNKVQKEYRLPADINEDFQRKVAHEYLSMTTKQAAHYTEMCSAQLEINYQSLKQSEISHRENSRIIMICVIMCLLIIALIWLLGSIRRRSFIDELTKVYNRRFLSKRLARNKKWKIPFSVLMIDIDDFKDVNDTYGHGEGDVVLKRLGEILNSRFVPNKVEPFRYGGEEFTVLVYSDVKVSPEMIADSIRNEFQNQSWNFNRTLTLSVGVAEEGTTEKGVSVMKQADINLYYAKKHGKNQVCNGKFEDNLKK